MRDAGQATQTRLRFVDETSRSGVNANGPRRGSDVGANRPLRDPTSA
jgi:hypothetical protein